jgi:hypothetical protein
LEKQSARRQLGFRKSFGIARHEKNLNVLVNREALTGIWEPSLRWRMVSKAVVTEPSNDVFRSLRCSS